MQGTFVVKRYAACILVALLVFATITSTSEVFAAKPDKGNGNNGNGNNANGNGNNGNGNNANGNGNNGNGNNANGNGNNGNGNNANANEESAVNNGKKSSGCKGKIIITNDPTVRGKCAIYDFQPPKIVDIMITPSNYLCVKATDDTGLASVAVNGVEIPKRLGTSGIFCHTDAIKNRIVTPAENSFGEIVILRGIGLAIQTTAKEVNLVGSMRITVSDLAGNVAGGKGVYNGRLGSPSSFTISAAPFEGSTVMHFAILKEVERNSHTNYTYSCSVDDGKHVITKTDGKIIIKNLSDKPLKNVRIYSNTVGKPFLLDQNKIGSIPAYGELTLTLISKVRNSDMPLDYEGQLVIAPENALPMTIPIDIK